MKILQLISRLVIGGVFAFSGFVKAIDPIGTGYKFEDYFGAMGIEWLTPMALTLSFILNAAELVIGLMLIVKVFPKFTYRAAMLFLLIFGPLTLWLAVANPITDCGCFGDFLKMSNWETFGKNVILFVFAVILLISVKKEKSFFLFKTSAIISLAFVIFSFGFQAYNYRNLPVVDFRAYHVGANIPDGMIYPEGAARDSFKTYLYYKKLETGIVEKFTEDNYPWQDEFKGVYEYDTMTSELVFEGYKPPIHDFVLSLPTGEDITKKVLTDPKYSFLLISYELEGADFDNYKDAVHISEFCKEKGYKFYSVSSSSPKAAKRVSDNSNLIFETVLADTKMLKTVIRSKPGLFVI